MDTIDTTLAAALIAAGAAIAAATLAFGAASRARRAAERTHAWERIRWALDHDRSGDLGYDISGTVLENVAELRWVPEKIASSPSSSTATRHGRTTMPRPRYEDLTPRGQEIDDHFRIARGATREEYEEWIQTSFAPLSVRFRWWRRRMRRALRWK